MIGTKEKKQNKAFAEVLQRFFDRHLQPPPPPASQDQDPKPLRMPPAGLDLVYQDTARPSVHINSYQLPSCGSVYQLPDETYQVWWNRNSAFIIGRPMVRSCATLRDVFIELLERGNRSALNRCGWVIFQVLRLNTEDVIRLREHDWAVHCVEQLESRSELWPAMFSLQKQHL
jgi:hypothetical protein